MAQLLKPEATVTGGVRNGSALAQRIRVARMLLLAGSTTNKVKDEQGGEWHVKIGPESQTEVVTSRIVWALGHGRHKNLLDKITVDDVKWMCERVMVITDRQFRDAFHAGGYNDELANRFVARIRQKAGEGLALP